MIIETREIDNKKIIAEVDRDDNSIDIAVVLNGTDTPITFNVAIVNNEMVVLRKWVGYGADSKDEKIFLDDIED